MIVGLYLVLWGKARDQEKEIRAEEASFAANGRGKEQSNGSSDSPATDGNTDSVKRYEKV